MSMKMRKIILALLFIAIIGLSGAVFYFANKASKLSSLSSKDINQMQTTSTSTTQNEITNLVEVIGKLIVLPVGEVPTIATVSDPEKLKDQTFFANAKVGDKVLIYVQAKKAFLYSVSLGKLIEVAPIDVGQSTSSTTRALTATTTPVKKR